MIITKLKILIKMIRITYSSKYAMKVANKYWQNTTITHGSMSEESFDNYYKDIIAIMNPNKIDKILDYGGGNGEISSRFKEDNFNIKHCDLSSQMVKNAKNKYQLISCECKNIKGKYNKILFHNAFFYIHPSLINSFLNKIFNLLEKDGQLYITDTPDFDKRDILKLGTLNMFFTKFFPIYQVSMSGFFVKDKQLIKIANEVGFSITKINSWCDYRSHWILTKKR